MGKTMQHIVKRAGHRETYDQRKLYASIFSACISVREHPGTAELVAQEVVEQFEAWMATKHEVTSTDISHQVGLALQIINPDAGYIYKHHRVIW